jgi:hypothetical protein
MFPHLAVVDTITEAEGEATAEDEEAVDRIVEEDAWAEDDRIVDEDARDEDDDRTVDEDARDEDDDRTVDEARLEDDAELVQVPKRGLQPVPQYAVDEPQ